MAIIRMHVQEPYHRLILNGKKTVEGRLNKGKFAALCAGDIIELEPERIRFKVTEKILYPTFIAMIEAEGVENVIPDKTDAIGAAQVYYDFFSEEEEASFGIVAIRIRRKDG